jgi:hypothetical protein
MVPEYGKLRGIHYWVPVLECLSTADLSSWMRTSTLMQFSCRMRLGLTLRAEGCELGPMGWVVQAPEGGALALALARALARPLARHGVQDDWKSTPEMLAAMGCKTNLRLVGREGARCITSLVNLCTGVSVGTRTQRPVLGASVARASTVSTGTDSTLPALPNGAPRLLCLRSMDIDLAHAWSSTRKSLGQLLEARPTLRVVMEVRSCNVARSCDCCDNLDI